MGDCQNNGPFWDPYYNTGPNLGDPKRDHNFDNPPYPELHNPYPQCETVRLIRPSYWSDASQCHLVKAMPQTVMISQEALAFPCDALEDVFISMSFPNLPALTSNIFDLHDQSP